jgi:hypothetical protein
MKRLLNILLLVLIGMILCSKSCVDENEKVKWQEKQVAIARDSICYELGADDLSDQAMIAAEANAVQKLEDLAVYLEVYLDSSNDSLFRAKAGEMIRDVFVSNDCELTFGTVKNEKTKSTALGKFLENEFGKDILSGHVIFDSIQVLEHLNKSGEELYSGKLTANQTITLYRLADSIKSPVIPVTVNFTSRKQVKIIGQDTLKVWVVGLGDMRVLK